jgi:hypothetical protein
VSGRLALKCFSEAFGTKRRNVSVHVLDASAALWVNKAWRGTNDFPVHSCSSFAHRGDRLGAVQSFNPASRERTDEERGQLMEDIARSYF